MANTEYTKYGYGFVDHRGIRYGRLMPLSYHPCIKKWRCLCYCGRITYVKATSLASGHTVSCGCYGRTVGVIHGMHKSKIYAVYHKMLDRCINPAGKEYVDYGGRGITVCSQWLGPSGFSQFYKDMGDRPSAQHSLDRIDNDGNYCPENCRWATKKEQSRNTRSNRRITLNGKTLCVTAWADELGMRPTRIYDRLNRGWPVEKALVS